MTAMDGDLTARSLVDAAPEELGALPDPHQEFLGKILTDLIDLSSKFNGATRYLKVNLATVAAKAEFGQYLWEAFPEASDTFYHIESALPVVAESDMASTQPLTVHVACLGFLAQQSPKPACGHEGTKVMLEMILKNGFQTGSEPLMVLRTHEPSECKELPTPWGDGGSGHISPLPMFSLSFLKGLRRTSSLMMILHYCMVNKISVAANLTELFETTTRIKVHHVAQACLAEETFQCMRISAKGSMRKACNVLDMVVMIKKMDMDVNAFARKWNSGMAATFHVQGKRLMSLRLLLEKAPQDFGDMVFSLFSVMFFNFIFPQFIQSSCLALFSLFVQDCLTLLLDYVAATGWQESCWTDDCLASKKLYPGYTFPSKSQAWRDRLQVTGETMTLMVRRVQAVHSISTIKKKITAAELEATAERAAVVYHLGMEFKNSTPVGDEIMKEKWFDAWADGSAHVDSEVQALILEKSESLKLASVPTLKRIMDSQMTSMPIQPSDAQTARIAKDEFDLVMKQLDYDLQVINVWKQKMSSSDVAREHAARDHQLQNHRKCEEGVAAFLDGMSAVTSWDIGPVESVISELLTFKRTLASKAGVEAPSIPMVCLLNWTAPSLIKTDIQDSQVNVMQWALNENLQSCGLVLYPVFAYRRGTLHMEESRTSKLLTCGNHNIDVQFSLLFAEASDSRDLRPLNYPGRFVLPSVLTDLNKTPWWSCSLRKSRRTDPVRQVPAKELKEIEDLGRDALPASTWTRDSNVHGAPKYCQIGSAAFEALLDGLLTGPDLSSTPAVIFVDLYSRVGDGFEAVVKKRNNFNVPLFYFGVAEDGKEKEWLEKSQQDALIEKVMDGSFKINGLQLSAEVSQDLLPAVPPKPKLNLLVIGKHDKAELPVQVAKTWQFHPTFGKDFTSWIDFFVEKGGSVQAEQAPDPQKNDEDKEKIDPKKRVAEGGPEVPAPKKAKKVVDATFIIDGDKITTPLLHEAKSGKGGLFIQIRAQHQVFLFNKSQQVVVLSDEQYIGSFGKGSFKLLKPEEKLKDNMVEFKLGSSGDTLVFNNKVATIGATISEAAKKKPDVAICYHQKTDDVQAPGRFKLALTHRVAFCAKAGSQSEAGSESQEKLSDGNICAFEKISTWTKSPVVKVLWQTRFCAKGLSPVKPGVYLNGGVSLSPNQGVLLTPSV